MTSPPRKRRSGPRSTPRLDRFDLYELCVTAPPQLVPFLRAVHGGNPKVLREDFSGSAAVARYWPQFIHRGTAIAVDKDPRPLSRCAGAPGVRAIASDVLRCRERADIISATNFPICYRHTRADLLRYLRHARSCLNPRGVFVADLYGGARSWEVGNYSKLCRGLAGERIDYTWEQRSASLLTGRVFNAIHFRVKPRAGAEYSLRNAFTYDWRLWSIPELSEAVRESGFRSVAIYDRLGAAIDQHGRVYAQPVTDDHVLDNPFVVYLVARR